MSMASSRLQDASVDLRVYGKYTTGKILLGKLPDYVIVDLNLTLVTVKGNN